MELCGGLSSFLSDSQWANILRRLSHTIRGIGDPLVATYARAFLTSKARDLADSFRERSAPHPINLFVVVDRL